MWLWSLKKKRRSGRIHTLEGIPGRLLHPTCLGADWMVTMTKRTHKIWSKSNDDMKDLVKQQKIGFVKGTPTPPFFRLERKDCLIFFIWNDGKHMLLVDDLFPENLDFHKSSFGENLIGTTLIYSFKNMAFRKKTIHEGFHGLRLCHDFRREGTSRLLILFSVR